MERRERARAEREWDRDKVKEFGKPGEEKEGGARRSRSRERRRKERGKSKEKKTEKKGKRWRCGMRAVFVLDKTDTFFNTVSFWQRKQLRTPLLSCLMTCSEKLKQLLAYTGFHLQRSR